MKEKWKVVFYRSPNGDYPVQRFIYSLDVKAQSKVLNKIKLLQDFGIRLGSPHIKKITGTELWELRILGCDSLRVLYVTMTGRTLLLLHGFKKKKDKTPQKEIKIAEGRLAEYRSR